MLGLLVLTGIYLYLVAARPWLNSFFNDESIVSLAATPADTYTYWFHAVSTSLSDLPVNLLGPVLFIKLFGANFDLIFLFYLGIFCYVTREFFHYKGKIMVRFLALFLLNPLIMVQFFAPNKEILILLSLLAAILYTYSGRKMHMFLALVFAAFSKPEFLLLLGLFFATRKLTLGWRRLVLLSMVIAITLVYSSMPNMSLYSETLFFGQTDKSLGITVLMQKLAVEYSMFPIVLIPRVLLAMFGGFAGAASISSLSGDETCILISGIFFLWVSVSAMVKRRFGLLRNEVFLLSLFLVMVSVVPFPHHRYVLPIYPLLLFIVLDDGSGKQRAARVS